MQSVIPIAAIAAVSLLGCTVPEPQTLAAAGVSPLGKSQMQVVPRGGGAFTGLAGSNWTSADIQRQMTAYCGDDARLEGLRVFASTQVPETLVFGGRCTRIVLANAGVATSSAKTPLR